MRYSLFLLFLLAGCKHKTDSTSHTHPPGKDSTLAGNLFGLPEDQYIGQLAATMVQSNKVIIGGVGYVGAMTPEFKSYKQLLAIAPDSFWVRFSYSKNPVERMYSIFALREKNSPELLEVADRLKKDSTTVMYESGCMTIPDWIDVVTLVNIGDTAGAAHLLKQRLIRDSH